MRRSAVPRPRQFRNGSSERGEPQVLAGYDGRPHPGIRVTLDWPYDLGCSEQRRLNASRTVQRYLLSCQRKLFMQVRFCGDKLKVANSLMVELQPWALVINTLGLSIALQSTGRFLCALQHFCVLAPPPIEVIFATMHSKIMSGIRILHVSSSYVISNLSGMDLSVAAFSVRKDAIKFRLPSEILYYAVHLPKNSSNNIVGEPLAEWHEIGHGDENGRRLYLIFERSGLVSNPVPLTLGLERSTATALLPVADGNQVNICLEIVFQTKDNVVYITVDRQDSPQLLIHNRTRHLLTVAKSSSEQDWSTAISLVPSSGSRLVNLPQGQDLTATVLRIGYTIHLILAHASHSLIAASDVRSRLSINSQQDEYLIQVNNHLTNLIPSLLIKGERRVMKKQVSPAKSSISASTMSSKATETYLGIGSKECSSAEPVGSADKGAKVEIKTAEEEQDLFYVSDEEMELPVSYSPWKSASEQHKGSADRVADEDDDERYEILWSDDGEEEPALKIPIPDDVVSGTYDLSRPLKLKKFLIAPMEMSVSVHTSTKFYIALDQSPLSFSEFRRTNVVTTPFRLGHALSLHYFLGAIYGTGWALGSLQLLGAPAGLARSVGHGLKNFVTFPYEGFMEGPTGFLFGIMHGSASLMKHITAGTLSSVNKLAGSWSRTLDRLTLSPDDLRYAEEMRRIKPQGIADGIRQGLTEFGVSFLGGVGGLAQQPLEYATGGQGKSLVGSLGRGLVGVMARPISGAAELVALTAHGILSGAGWADIHIAEKLSQKRITEFVRESRRALNSVSSDRSFAGQSASLPPTPPSSEQSLARSPLNCRMEVTPLTMRKCVNPISCMKAILRFSLISRLFATLKMLLMMSSAAYPRLHSYRILFQVNPVVQRLLSTSNPVQTVEEIEKRQKVCSAPEERVHGNAMIHRAGGQPSSGPVPIQRQLSEPQPIKSLENGLSYLRLANGSPAAVNASSIPTQCFFNSSLRQASSPKPEIPLEVSVLERAVIDPPSKPALLPPVMFTTNPKPQEEAASSLGHFGNPTASSSGSDPNLGLQPPNSYGAPPGAGAGNPAGLSPLTKAQLLQAVNYLLKNDADFVNKLHEAYVKSFVDMVS
ncbi:unnamed protein product [Nesidiocoris tenuis]|uniref:mRNA-decapping enzyme C-terminal domain-containing protein n=1 Tax=Nesidiocoris tenuis TaxID=355587 RepID=A0A6H5HIH5_9HEMI|nr:unnamed protein product [Nesidiocoris tenuis]